MTTSLEIQSAEWAAIPRTVDLSVVLPAYNEADHISKVIERLLEEISAVANSFELVVVDDGSSDGTFEKIALMASQNKSIIPLKNPRNLGKGAAIKSASGVARGDVVILLDADMDIAPTTLRMYQETLEKYDLCIASKRHPKSDYSAPPMRKFLSIGFNALVRLMTGVAFSDSQTGLKAMKGVYFKRIINMITVKRYAYDVEILAVAQLMKLKIAELPVTIEQKSLFSARAVFYMMIDLLGISYRLRVLKWYQKNLTNPTPTYKPVLPI